MNCLYSQVLAGGVLSIAGAWEVLSALHCRGWGVAGAGYCWCTQTRPLQLPVAPAAGKVDQAGRSGGSFTGTGSGAVNYSAARTATTLCRPGQSLVVFRILVILAIIPSVQARRSTKGQSMGYDLPARILAK